ncbi:MAG TPA: sugar ABC transporter permease [Anaerolineae bacterium]|nr:sugar ABC transporter permease [Anaerolineae bacterium]
MTHRTRKTLVWYAFIAPVFILFTIFVLYPTIETFRLSLFREVATKQQFVGLAQFARLASDAIFRGALLNTILLGAAFLIIIIPLGLVLASLLNSLKFAPNFFKVIYFLPQITSTVALALIFAYIFQPSWGLLNNALRSIGVDPLPLWLADPRYNLTGARAAATILAVWIALGYYMLIFLAGLQAVPTELYDAAIVDGANFFQVWWYITLPNLRPTFVFLILTGTIDALSRFSDLYTLGGPAGTPARSLQTVVMYMYQIAFEGNDFNLSSAVAVILFLIMLSVTIFNFRALLHREFSRES